MGPALTDRKAPAPAANKEVQAINSRRKAAPARTRVSGTPDSVTILMTAPGHTASKRFVKTASGVTKIDFNAGYLFGVMKTLLVDDIYGLSKAIMAVESFPNMLVIRGLPADDAFVGNWVRRTGSEDVGNFFTPPAGHHWVLIDFDKIKIPKRLSLKRDPVAVCEHLVRLLPAEFHNASYHWQMSSSAGIGAADKVSMHIWFWLVRPTADLDLKSWAKSFNDEIGYKLVDPALFQHVQAHYTAAPIFDGVDNPFPTRSGLHTKAQNEVVLILPAPAEKPPRCSTVGAGASEKRAAFGAGFAYHLSRIGDHAGGDGFHDPIVAAAASYVGEHGKDGTDIETVYELIRDAVLAADATGHDAATVADRASRAHIMSAIESALKKFGNQVTRRKTKLHAGVPPHFHSTPITAAEAAQKLVDIASLEF